MNEIRFFQKNIRDWEAFERDIKSGESSNPDKLSAMYIRITDDLSYANTFFPGSQAAKYLNQLTSEVHATIYRHKPVAKKGVKHFWMVTLPLINYSIRKEIAISFAIFVVAMLIGIVSNQNDETFARLIMGDAYINMTNANIASGDAMAVYKSMNRADMFMGISINNIRVSFITFLFGLLTPVGTAFMIIQNGIMLGVFQSYLAQNGLLLASSATIWVHGTLEIFAIIVAGAAGIVVGNSILFPGSYARTVSFARGVRKGAMVVFGLMPVFLMAAFFEGFVTRYTTAPYFIRFGIAGLSLGFIVWYFFLLPRRILKTQK